MTTRLRFAPSPTGALHLGGARTSLFNWLYAKHTGGKFLLRIEDTDQDRNTAESVQIIIDGMAWLGIHADEPLLVQSTRFEHHVKEAWRLVAEGKAYKCFSTPEELEAMREKAVAEGRKPKYDGTWRDRTDHPPEGTPFVIRFRMPEGGSVTFDDMVLGPITVNNEELDDLILVRSDGTPTYNFVVVCDDAFMRITHVVRGQDHVSNTPRQVHLYNALGYELPRFAHLPMVDGLSKRKGSASVTSYREVGYLREAVINYIARLGWSHGDQEIFTVDELVELFDLADVNKASGAYDETKLAWVNSEWMKKLDAADLAARLIPYLAKLGVAAEPDARLTKLVAALQSRAHNLVEMAEGAKFAYLAPTAYDDAAIAKWFKPDTKPAFVALLDRLAALDVFETGTIEAAFNATLEQFPVGMGKLAQPVRIGLTGVAVSPPIFEALQAVGKDESLRRLQLVVSRFAS